VTSNLVSGFDLPLLFDCRVLHTMVYCEAVQSAILATAWLLVVWYTRVTDGQTGRRTDGWAIAYSALSICYMLSRSKNETTNILTARWVYRVAPKK